MSYQILDGNSKLQQVFAYALGVNILPGHVLLDVNGNILATPGNPLSIRLYDGSGNLLGTSGNPLYTSATGNTPGSLGVDYSTGQPSLPVLGSNFSNVTPWNNFVLLQTVPASLSRNNYRIRNLSGAIIVVIRDDGTAMSGSTLNNPTAYALAPGVGAGSSGELDSDPYFKGRLQIFAPSSPAQVAISVE